MYMISLAQRRKTKAYQGSCMHSTVPFFDERISLRWNQPFFYIHTGNLYKDCNLFLILLKRLIVVAHLVFQVTGMV